MTATDEDCDAAEARAVRPHRPKWSGQHGPGHIAHHISHITHHITYHITYHVAYHITCHIVARQHPRFVESHSVRLITWQIIQPVSGGAVIRKLGLHTLHRCIANASPISASIKHHQIYICTLAICAVRMQCQPQPAAHACELSPLDIAHLFGCRGYVQYIDRGLVYSTMYTIPFAIEQTSDGLSECVTTTNQLMP